MNNLKKIIKYTLILITTLSLSLFTLPIKHLYKENYIEFYDINGNLLTSEIKEKTSKYIYLNDLNKYTIDAFIAFEDKNFYSHKGFDFPRIIKSFFTNIVNTNITSGASTITQQYARISFLNNEKTIMRKLKEAYYTIRLESKYNKDEILEGYLNNIYLGHGCYGIECASNYYFNKSSTLLTINESALLASLASSPSYSSPINNYNRSMARKNRVLEAMYKENYISKTEYLNLSKTDVNLQINHKEKDNINYYLDQVKSKINSLNIPINKGLKVYTNFDLNLYSKINKIATSYASSDNELSIIILKNNSNKIVFNIGGYNYNASPYNRAIYSNRQIGSTIKTFLFSFALENNLGIDTKFQSEKTTFYIKNHGSYSPSNANNKYANQPINMEEAFATSDNIYATKLLLLLGSNNFVNYLNKFKLSSNKALPSIALGSVEFSLIQLANAYSVFANNGYYLNYSFIDRITDSYGNPLFSSSSNKNFILAPQHVSTMKNLLQLPFENKNYYTSSTLGSYNIKNMYGKTGSTKSDSYVIGINNDYTIAIRCGIDDINMNFHSYSIPKKVLKEISMEI